MNLHGIHHVSINVSDVDTARDFYVNLLGLEPLERPNFAFPGAWLRSGEQEVHLIGVDSGPPLKEQHFAFRVSDIEAIRQKLERAGVRCSKPVEIAGVCLQAFTHDPSGNMVEFNQRL
jgi:catechol 2,3-dioxygenase-like lactoylglutathione lyase family enzyme